MFGYDKAHLVKRIGHESQLGGLKAYTLTDGRSAGIRAVDFRTIRGLEFTVLLDRCMDISEARYKGISLCWRSGVGDVAPAFYEPQGMGWLRSFFGGMLTTCGLTQVGNPEIDEGEELGLHGRIAMTPAERVCLQQQWQDDNLIMSATGVIREGRLFGTSLEMCRTITAPVDGTTLTLRDTVTNIGARKSPCMLLYHINIGFPLLDDGSKFMFPSKRVEKPPTQEDEIYARMHAPVYGYEEKEFMHIMQPDPEGYVTVGVINRNLANGIGLRLRYLLSECPCFNEWKYLSERDYVVGIEPGNCLPTGRSNERKAGRLVELEVGQAISSGIELEVVEGAEVLDKLVREASTKYR